MLCYIVQWTTTTDASAYRPIGRYWRSKHRKLMTSVKLMADAPLKQLTITLTLTLTLSLQPYLYANINSNPKPYPIPNPNTNPYYG